MNFQRILVRSRFDVEHCCCVQPHAVVSVYDYAGQPAQVRISRETAAVLYLSFQDFDPVRREYVEGEMYHGYPLALQWMKPTHALSLWRFLQAVWQDAPTLIVHGNEAVSRAPAIAMAIADTLNLPRSVISWVNAQGEQDPQRDVNNRHVYDTMVQAAGFLGIGG